MLGSAARAELQGRAWADTTSAGIRKWNREVAPYHKRDVPPEMDAAHYRRVGRLPECVYPVVAAAIRAPLLACFEAAAGTCAPSADAPAALREALHLDRVIADRTGRPCAVRLPFTSVQATMSRTVAAHVDADDAGRSIIIWLGVRTQQLEALGEPLALFALWSLGWLQRGESAAERKFTSTHMIYTTAQSGRRPNAPTEHGSDTIANYIHVGSERSTIELPWPSGYGGRFEIFWGFPGLKDLEERRVAYVSTDLVTAAPHRGAFAAHVADLVKGHGFDGLPTRVYDIDTIVKGSLSPVTARTAAAIKALAEETFDTKFDDIKLRVLPSADVKCYGTSKHHDANSYEMRVCMRARIDAYGNLVGDDAGDMVVQYQGEKAVVKMGQGEAYVFGFCPVAGKNGGSLVMHDGGGATADPLPGTFVLTLVLTAYGDHATKDGFMSCGRHGRTADVSSEGAASGSGGGAVAGAAAAPGGGAEAAASGAGSAELPPVMPLRSTPLDLSKCVAKCAPGHPPQHAGATRASGLIRHPCVPPKGSRKLNVGHDSVFVDTAKATMAAQAAGAPCDVMFEDVPSYLDACQIKELAYTHEQLGEIYARQQKAASDKGSDKVRKHTDRSGEIGELRLPGVRAPAGSIVELCEGDHAAARAA
ncbi:MAG: hypothetical protein J3K34DRAFT_394134, partial [Monoraphidium minutum]